MLIMFLRELSWVEICRMRGLEVVVSSTVDGGSCFHADAHPKISRRTSKPQSAFAITTNDTTYFLHLIHHSHGSRPVFIRILIPTDRTRCSYSASTLPKRNS